MQDAECSKYPDCCNEHTDRISSHDGRKSTVLWKDKKNPKKPRKADAENSDNSRGKGFSKAAEVTGHDNLRQRKDIGKKDILQTDISYLNDLIFFIKDGKQRASV